MKKNIYIQEQTTKNHGTCDRNLSGTGLNIKIIAFHIELVLCKLE